ncbi:MAG: hypothetical protein ACTSU5_16445 [Promethearchaeota archaeon]
MFVNEIIEDSLYHLYFVNVTRGDGRTFLHWENQPEYSERRVHLELMKARNFPGNRRDYYNYMTTQHMKLVFREFEPKLLLTVGASHDEQFAVMEALLDEVIKAIWARGDPKVFFYSYEEQGERLAREISGRMLEISQKVLKDDIAWLRVKCKVCDEMLDVAVKRNSVLNSENSPVPFVFLHKSHAIQMYVDRAFQVRSASVANFSG